MFQNDDIVIDSRKRFMPFNIKELWAYRDLLYFLVWRDIKVKYKQTLLGIAWAVLRPFLMMVVFSVLFGYFAKVPSDGIPYPIFVYTGLLVWTYFSSALINSGSSLLSSSNLITKTYFPRLIIPMSASIACLVDFFIAFAMLIAMMFYYNYVPGVSGMVVIPVLVLLIFMAALGCSLWLSALTVEYRDMLHAVPFLIQIWMFATPVIYPLSLFPEEYHWILLFNPMGGIIEAFRASTLGRHPINWNALAVSSGIIFVIFATGLLYFRKVERSFADII